VIVDCRAELSRVVVQNGKYNITRLNYPDKLKFVRRIFVLLVILLTWLNFSSLALHRAVVYQAVIAFLFVL